MTRSFILEFQGIFLFLHQVIRIFSGGRVKLEEMSRDPAIKQLLIDGFLEADDRLVMPSQP